MNVPIEQNLSIAVCSVQSVCMCMRGQTKMFDPNLLIINQHDEDYYDMLWLQNYVIVTYLVLPSTARGLCSRRSRRRTSVPRTGVTVPHTTKSCRGHESITPTSAKYKQEDIILSWRGSNPPPQYNFPVQAVFLLQRKLVEIIFSKKSHYQYIIQNHPKIKSI